MKMESLPTAAVVPTNEIVAKVITHFLSIHLRETLINVCDMEKDKDWAECYSGEHTVFSLLNTESMATEELQAEIHRHCQRKWS